jgi:hypothetical protein
MINRKITPNVLSALKDTPVVVLHGARQTGKSTLIKELIRQKYSAEYVTLDDSSILSAASNNPRGFLEAFDKNIAIDEVQRAPELFLEIKRIVDENRKPGRFILTGSANVLLIPRISESLAGRVEILNLFPFSQNELSGSSFNILDIMFEDKIKIPAENKSSDSLIKRIVKGGYPEVNNRLSTDRRNAWFNSYMTSILQRDIRDISNIEGMTQLPRLLNIIASRAGSLLNFAEFARLVAIPQTTLKRYFTMLNSVFMIYYLQPYSGNFSRRLIKTPKIYLYDTGLLTYLISADELRLKHEPSLSGAVIENFVLMELLKQVSWSNKLLKIYFYRTNSGQEVDFVIERSDGSIIGIEVKATHSPRAEMFNGLRHLESEYKTKFKNGYLFYNGDKIIPFAKNMTALPISTLWI